MPYPEGQRRCQLQHSPKDLADAAQEREDGQARGEEQVAFTGVECRLRAESPGQYLRYGAIALRSAQALAGLLLASHMMPQKASPDALHVATAAIGGVKYSFTSNCRHIENAREPPRAYELLERKVRGELWSVRQLKPLGASEWQPHNRYLINCT